MRSSITTLVLFAVTAAACSGIPTLNGGESFLQPEPVSKKVTVQVLAGDDLTSVSADVEIDGVSYQTGEDGILSFEWNDEQRGFSPILAVSAGGFEVAVKELMDYPEDGQIEIRLDPVVLRGRVVTIDEQVIPDVEVRLGDAQVWTDDQGQFSFVRAQAGSLTLLRPAWADLSEQWDGVADQLVFVMEPRFVRALRVSSQIAGKDLEWSRLLDLASGSGVNGLVVDIKNERGQVLHDTSVSIAHRIGAVNPAYDLDQLVADMEEVGFYKISRIVVFQDTILAIADPTFAVWNAESASAWRTGAGEAWIDPTDPDAWEYSLELAVEACRRGFDEVQFDYVSFPFGGSLENAEFDGFNVSDYGSKEAQQQRMDAISAYLNEARDRLNPLGCAVAANVFSILLESETDEGIGQMPESLSSVVDVLSPTIYTHLYPDGWAGFSEPDDNAPEIVGIAVRAGLQRLDGLAIMRPWVQRAFLEPEEIRAVQNQVESNSLGWMLWSANSDFKADMLPPEVE